MQDMVDNWWQLFLQLTHVRAEPLSPVPKFGFHYPVAHPFHLEAISQPRKTEETMTR